MTVIQHCKNLTLSNSSSLWPSVKLWSAVLHLLHDGDKCQLLIWTSSVSKGSLTPSENLTLCCCFPFVKHHASHSLLHRNGKHSGFCWNFETQHSFSTCQFTHNPIFKSLLEWSCRHQQLWEQFDCVCVHVRTLGCFVCLLCLYGNMCCWAWENSTSVSSASVKCVFTFAFRD